MKNSTNRFSDRVENYIKYRPSYPAAAIDLLSSRCGLREKSVIADVGAGTGILTRLLLERGYTVFAVEPNAEMREAAEKDLDRFQSFVSVAATAEETGLEAGSVDLVVAAQAFHWFDVKRCREEFRRILKADGWVALLWNERQVDSMPLLREYETLLEKHATDYAAVDHRNIGDDSIRAFFNSDGYESASFKNLQEFDYEGLKGRCLSSSYAPNVGQSSYEPMIAELKRIFDRHHEENVMVFEYRTNVYLGRLRE